MAEYKKASFIDEFELPVVTHDAIKQQLIKVGKNRTVSRVKSVKDMPLEERLKYITDEVYKTLGRYKGFVRVIDNDKDFESYIDYAIKRGIMALDTETNRSLDPLTCKLMGICLYVPNTKPVYVPVSHCVSGTDTLLSSQVSHDCIKRCLKKINDSDIKVVYHNGKFDIRVFHGVEGIYPKIWWDTMIASQLLDENIPAKLKTQYPLYVDPTIDSYNIEELFTGLPYEWIPVDIFAMYAAIDSYDTYKLQQAQQKVFESDGMDRLYNLFMTIEMPVVTITAEMEDNGICIDTDVLNRIDSKLKKSLEETKKKIDDFLVPYEKDISRYQYKGILSSPISLDSPKQLQTIMYDILKYNSENGRKTDKDTLKEINSDFTKLLLEYRHNSKLISSFTTPLPQLISKRDGKLHAHFNQMGKEDNNVRTGRFSSTEPNLQQIPSHYKVMRMMFKASDDNTYTDIINNAIHLSSVQEVLTGSGWKFAKDVSISDVLITDDNGGFVTVSGIEIDGNDFIFTVTEEV